MPADRQKQHRRSTRLAGFDYTSSGYYFVTLCTRDRQNLFGEVAEGEVSLNANGLVARKEWLKTATIRREVRLDEFVIMPNHIHAIVIIQNDAPRNIVGAHGRAPLHRPSKSLGSLIAGFKSATAKRINRSRGTTGRKVWQRNYYEHIVRDAEDLFQTRKYVLQNPLKWVEDEYFRSLGGAQETPRGTS